MVGIWNSEFVLSGYELEFVKLDVLSSLEASLCCVV